jgi:pyruvate,water dikinase
LAVSEYLSPINHLRPDDMKYIRPLISQGNADVALVVGKNASLGEMVSRLGAHGVSVPNRIAITAQTYFDFLSTKYIYG